VWLRQSVRTDCVNAFQTFLVSGFPRQRIALQFTARVTDDRKLAIRFYESRWVRNPLHNDHAFKQPTELRAALLFVAPGFGLRVPCDAPFEQF
jgi:hypothetical protein